jgi:hypothetical protein
VIGKVQGCEMEDEIGRGAAQHIRQLRHTIRHMASNALGQLARVAARPHNGVDGPAIRHQPLGKLATDEPGDPVMTADRISART